MPPKALVAHGKIGKEQMMIDDDDVAFQRAPVHLRDEAAVELLAFLPRAQIASRIQLPPDAAVLGNLDAVRCGRRFQCSSPNRESFR